MAPIWSLGTVPIIVNGDDHKPDTRLSEHIVLDGTESILHRFGYGSGVRSLSAYILGDNGEYEDIVDYYHNQDTVELISDQGSEGNYRVWSVSRKRVLDTRRTKPVFQLQIELKSVNV